MAGRKLHNDEAAALLDSASNINNSRGDGGGGGGDAVKPSHNEATKKVRFTSL